MPPGGATVDIMSVIATRRGLSFVASAVLFAAAVLVSVLAIPRDEDVDSGSYRSMARGGQVCRPYAGRVLHPALVRCAVKTGVAPETAFAAVNAASAVAFYVLLLALMPPMRPAPKAFVLLISPLWWVWGGNIYIQDMFAAALAAAMFMAVFLAYDRGGSGLRESACGLLSVGALLFLMQVTRESSAVFALSLAVLAWRRKARRLAAVSVAAMAAGMAVVSWSSGGAQPNTNELGGLAYLVCKAVANGVRNFTGIVPWNDGYAMHLACYYPDPPAWKCSLPAFLQWGNVHEIGIYAFQPETIARTLAIWLLYFPGAVALWFMAPRIGRRMPYMSAFGFARMPLHVQLACVSGGIFWLLAPFSGPSLMRLVGYGWPLFWIALPHMRRTDLS